MRHAREQRVTVRLSFGMLMLLCSLARQFAGVSHVIARLARLIVRIGVAELSVLQHLHLEANDIDVIHRDYSPQITMPGWPAMGMTLGASRPASHM